jgi:PPOX class probable FMN-dependent enzyme
MQTIKSIEELEAAYGAVSPAALDKVLPHLSPLYQKWISASRFMILSTVGPSGTDASPRGDAGPVVRIVDESTLWLPDWRGNNRLDSLRNIVEDGRLSLMFMVPGSNTVVRVNGTAVLTSDATITTRFEQNGKHPRTVIVVQVAEVYFQCAKALMRSRLWESSDESTRVPTAGEFIGELQAGFDGRAYDEGFEEYVKDRMW